MKIALRYNVAAVSTNSSLLFPHEEHESHNTIVWDVREGEAL